MSEEENNLDVDDLEQVPDEEPSPEPVKKKTPAKAAAKSKTAPAVPVSAASGKAAVDAEKKIVKAAASGGGSGKKAVKKDGAPSTQVVKQELPYTSNGELIETDLPPTLGIPRAFFKTYDNECAYGFRLLFKGGEQKNPPTITGFEEDRSTYRVEFEDPAGAQFLIHDAYTSLGIDKAKEKQLYQLLSDIGETPRMTQKLGAKEITWGRIIVSYGKPVKISQKTFEPAPETPEIIEYLMEKMNERIDEEETDRYNRCTAFFMNKASDAITSLSFEDVINGKPAEIVCFGGGTRSLVIRKEKQVVENVDEETGHSRNKSKPGAIIKKMTLCTGKTLIYSLRNTVSHHLLLHRSRYHIGGFQCHPCTWGSARVHH
jgi:hypothetical protein